MYDNQNEIDAEERKLKAIDPSWSIGGYSIAENKAIAIEFSLPIKGNAKKIKELENDGWTRERRFKACRYPYMEEVTAMFQKMKKFMS